MQKNHGGGRRDRSRSPIAVDQVGRRRGSSNNKQNNYSQMDNNGVADMSNNMANNMNAMMMNNMYQQGNMMMSGMFPNMMMQNMMGGGMMQAGNMDMMSGAMQGAMPGMQGMMQGAVQGSMPTCMQGTVQPPLPGQIQPPLPGQIQPPLPGQNMPTTGMEMMPQQTMDIAPMPAPPLPPNSGSMDMNLMGGMMMDPSMMGMGNMGMYSNMGGDMAISPVKEEIVLKHCVLTPADPGTAEPPRRMKPLGCRTIFVGGLPDKIKESIVRDIFERYGRIHQLRLSKKNFCHIRFDRENCVDLAMQLSGYRIKIVDKDSKDKEDEDNHSNTGWLHVDYAISRDDQNEYERKQRQVLRAQQAQMEQLTAQQEYAAAMTGRQAPAMYRSPSPPIRPFSNAAITQMSEKIKSEEHFAVILPTLLAWLERGECSKKNSNQFYSMIQATNSHIRRLYSEKMQSEEELQEFKERTKQKIENIIEQLEQVGKVFNAATHQRVWDHFTKPQRKNIETWQKMTQDFSNLKDEFLEKFENEHNNENNMDMGNGYNMESMNDEVNQQLKRENESLQFQLEAYKNEVDVIKSESKKEMEKFKAQFIARQALQSTLEQKNPPLPSPVVKPPPPPPLPEDLDAKVHIKDEVEAGCGEAKLIGVMSAFLQVHPQGASLDYVVSYVRALFPHVSQATVHHVLQKHTDVFQRTTSGVGANIENRWAFVAFTPTPSA
ncbi:hypothetical protein JYU34_021269 [Plutella xylostella]|uniref:RRM domain-containing protein n=1 Tax=Plutella xylostella TaxID=51655 RepID=A0ABQ7PWY6_PLUXY|nr:hypothetical protein JYU34_021269 [Plutella xylostella]